MKIGIVGLGLIGGSLGLDLKRNNHTVYGFSRSPETCDVAQHRGAVDSADCNPKILSPAEVVFLCPPLGLMETVFKSVQPFLSPAATVTDVGSVKTSIVQTLSSQWPNFVGGHPMAGTEESGIEAAQYNLFLGRPYVLTPTPSTHPNTLKLLSKLIKELGARLVLATPEAHDRAVSLISHLPILISASLIATCTDQTNQDSLELAYNLASSGFVDTSRVGGGNPELGRMVAQHNREELLRSLSTFEQQVSEFRQLIENAEWSLIEEKLKLTQFARSQFLNCQK